MKNTLLSSVCCLSVTLGFAMPAPALASSALLADYGCINCHGSYPRGDAPTLQGLAEKMAKYRGDEAGLTKKITKFRTGETLEHVDAHERISLEAATQLLHWLADGVK